MLRAPRFLGVPVPTAALFGPEAVAAVGAPAALEAARSLAGEHTLLLGEGRSRSLGVRYGNGPAPERPHPTEEHRRLLDRLAGAPSAS